MRIFLSHYSQEQSDAEDIADHLKMVFRNQGIEIFLGSSWESLAPGDAWEEKLIKALEETEALLVLMSVDAIGRPWLNFEMGVAWARKTRILIFCHKGLTPSGLPRPYSSLQAVDINNLKHDEKLRKVGEAVSQALNLVLPSEASATASMEPPERVEPGSFASVYRSWQLRPTAHINETVTGRFLIGAVNPTRPDRARTAELEPGETLYVRLFIGSSPEGRYVPTLVTGKVASFFETVLRDTVQIDATLRLAAAFDEGENTIPIIVIDEYKVVSK